MAKRKTKSYPFLEQIVGQLTDLPRFRSRPLFGGHGLYVGDHIFAIVYREKFYLRTTDETRAECEAAGWKPFRPYPELTLGRYFEVPAGVLADPVVFREWAVWAANANAAR